ncbi:class I SAM-dependent methyltransferase [Alicyclobacillus fodiniaquatilis]|uniref:Class I SAM-dependent methyltransferase n=1 Tax=Alicyclobacillus fodiniaquatilis TaxID=1661150 RepID=A0ABW4JDN3_9BACL
MDKDYWNEQFRSRQNKLFSPEEYLVKNIECFRPGSVLDVACGDGRNAIFLSKHGYDVTGIDFANEGLRRLRDFASTQGLRLNTHEINADDTERITTLGQFDNAIFVHFKPSIKTFLAVSNLVRSNGIILMTSFNYRHLLKSPQFPSQLCYGEAEFLNRSSLLDLVEYVSYSDERGFLDGYIFRKQSAP